MPGKITYKYLEWRCDGEWLAFRDFRDVYFNHLRPSAVDVSRTPDVTIAQGEFHNASFGSLKFDGGCENIVIKVCMSQLSAKLYFVKKLKVYHTLYTNRISNFHKVKYHYVSLTLLSGLPAAEELFDVIELQPNICEFQLHGVP